MAALTLYQYASCPFCYRVTAALRTLDVEVEIRDILRDARSRTELIAAQGRSTVPVLKIVADDGSERWLPESRDIIEYLRNLG